MWLTGHFGRGFLQPLDERTPYLHQFRWWIGTVLVVIGAIADFASFALAPQSLVAPTGAFTLGAYFRAAKAL